MEVSRLATSNTTCNSTAEYECVQRTALEAASSKRLILLEFPEHFDAQHCHTLWKSFVAKFEVERPSIRLDLSHLKSIDNVGIDTLLDCFDETLRRDGDIEITAMSDEAAAILEITGIDTIVYCQTALAPQPIRLAQGDFLHSGIAAGGVEDGSASKSGLETLSMLPDRSKPNRLAA